MEEKGKPSRSSGESLFRSPPWDAASGSGSLTSLFILEFDHMQQTLGQVENWELKVQGEQGEHRLRTEEKGEKGPGAELYHSPTIRQAPCRVTVPPQFSQAYKIAGRTLQPKTLKPKKCLGL